MFRYYISNYELDTVQIFYQQYTAGQCSDITSAILSTEYGIRQAQAKIKHLIEMRGATIHLKDLYTSLNLSLSLSLTGSLSFVLMKIFVLLRNFRGGAEIEPPHKENAFFFLQNIGILYIQEKSRCCKSISLLVLEQQPI